MRIRKLVIGLLVGASLLAGSVSVGAWNGNTAGSPDTYRCTRINTTPGNLAARYGNPPPYVTCTDSFRYTPPPVPMIAVTKTADTSYIAPVGGPVIFRFTVRNPSSTDPITITSLVDNIYGDLATATDFLSTNCDPLFGTTLAPGASASCVLTANVFNPNPSMPFSQTDTVTVTGTDAAGRTATATATATATIPALVGV